MNKEEFKNAIESLGLNLTPEISKKLEIYCCFLLEYNTHTNLTAIKTEEEVYLKHFYDSLTIAKIIDLNKESSLLDIGSGAGFPGMVLKIFFPHLHVVLVDSNNKKTKFLEQLKVKIAVDNLEVFNNRIESLTPQFLNFFDVVTARAVTNLPVLTELAIPLVKENKFFIAMKGNAQEELENSKYAITKLNCQINDILVFELNQDSGTRTLIKINKNKPSKLEDLRTYEKIIKKPLQKPNK